LGESCVRVAAWRGDQRTMGEPAHPGVELAESSTVQVVEPKQCGAKEAAASATVRTDDVKYVEHDH